MAIAAASGLDVRRSALLAVEDLRVQFIDRRGVTYAVNGVTFSIEPGEILGIVGESGCGKTVTALALMRLLPSAKARVRGSVWLGGRNILDVPEREMRSIRGGQVGFIFQEPMASLNPSLSIGTQIVESIRTHRDVSRRQARIEAERILEQVGIADSRAILSRYPHEVSGGIGQRILIASALAPHPELLIADEPTTSLDVSTQAEVIDVLAEVTREMKTAVILITHDMGVVARATSRTIVMYGGFVVESGTTLSALTHPEHPYTIGLLESTPRLLGVQTRLVPIEGYPSTQRSKPVGCVFAPRCRWRLAECDEEVPQLAAGESAEADRGASVHQLACHNPPRTAPKAVAAENENSDDRTY